jgi:hypothetical protein
MLPSALRMQTSASALERKNNKNPGSHKIELCNNDLFVNFDVYVRATGPAEQFIF